MLAAQPRGTPCCGSVRPQRRASARACHGGAAPQPDVPAVPRRAVLSGLAGAALLPGSGSATAALSPSEERAAAFLRFVAAQDARPSALAVPDFPAAATWFNAPPLSLARELRGRVLVLDFFTLCCVNCMHVLPELAATEAKYAAAPVTVVGVHSPKFAAEGDDAAIRAAVLRYGVTHPVLNDARKVMWDALRVDAWPTLAVVAPTGRLITTLSGEGHQRDLEDLIEASLAYYGAKGLLSQAGPPPVALERDKDARVLSSSLSFPGKLAVDAAGGRLFISDSSHHRVVAVELATGRFLFAVGGAAGPGLADGTFEAAAFRRPQGVAYDAGSDCLFVADTDNHALRLVDLKARRVTTLAGDGERGRDYRGGGGGASQRLNSPWDVAALGGGEALVAMAGTHQLWRWARGAATAVSGDGYERNANGPDSANSSWAQPSGLAVSADGATAYVADAESSSLRCADLRTGGARLLAGGDANYADNLFRFGDADGVGAQVRLQHPLGVALDEAADALYFADSYNHKLKKLQLSTGRVTTLAGGAGPGLADGAGAEARLSEPSGLALAPGGLLYVADTNNCAVRVLNIATNTLRTLDTTSVPRPALAAASEASPAAADAAPSLPAGTAAVRAPAGVAAAAGELAFALALPPGYHLTKGAGSAFAAEVFPPAAASVSPAAGPLAGDGRVRFTRSPSAPPGLLRVTCRVYFCQDEAVCLFQAVAFELPLLAAQAGAAPADVALAFSISPRAPRADALPAL